jgi:periplasmic copper chaperone A
MPPIEVTRSIALPALTARGAPAETDVLRERASDFLHQPASARHEAGSARRETLTRFLGVWSSSGSNPAQARRVLSVGCLSMQRSFDPPDASRGTAAKHLVMTMRSVRMKAALYLTAVTLLSFGQVAGARCEKLIVSDGWVQAADKIGLDIPLFLTIRNETDQPDALLRARCPVTNFSEKHIVDHGEGAPAMRPIPSIPIPPNSTVVLSDRGYHVMLLQTNRPLAVDDRFICTFVFQKAGAVEAEVKVRGSP